LQGEWIQPIVLAREDFPITRLAFSPNSQLLLTAQDGISVNVWDAANRECLAQFKTHRGTINGLAFSADGRYFASAAADGTIRLWGLV
jgi:WD40 repeat protein